MRQSQPADLCVIAALRKRTDRDYEEEIQRAIGLPSAEHYSEVAAAVDMSVAKVKNIAFFGFDPIGE